jgi:hypothetical protein
MPVVPDGKIAELPFKPLGWEGFERLILALAVDVNDLTEAWRYGASGQAQDGIDIVGFAGADRQAHVYQCKNVRDFTASQLRAAIAKFADGRRPFDARRLVIAVAAAANRTGVVDELAAARLRHPDLTLELWDSAKLGDLLRERPSIVEQFFGDDAARGSVPRQACR